MEEIMVSVPQCSRHTCFSPRCRVTLTFVLRDLHLRRFFWCSRLFARWRRFVGTGGTIGGFRTLPWYSGAGRCLLLRRTLTVDQEVGCVQVKHLNGMLAV